jgi:predicted DNA binding CopG/RHH family protein
MSRPIPDLRTDQDAEALLDQDLSDLDFSQFKPAHFEFEPKAAQINMRLPQALLDAVKARSSARGIPYTRYIREVLEQAVAAPRR